jgi:hypothetical protein
MTLLTDRQIDKGHGTSLWPDKKKLMELQYLNLKIVYSYFMGVCAIVKTVAPK